LVRQHGGGGGALGRKGCWALGCWPEKKRSELTQARWFDICSRSVSRRIGTHLRRPGARRDHLWHLADCGPGLRRDDGRTIECEAVMRRREWVVIKHSSGSRISAALAAAVIALLHAGTASTQTEKVNGVISEQVKAEEAARASQKRVEQLDEETTKMLGDYRQMLAESTSLKSYNEQLAAQVKSQEDQIKEMSQQIEQIATTSREVLPMMDKMLATLAQFVELDIPFLLEERTQRVAQLKDMMTRADVSTSEKYRRIVEAYQIEMEYGRTIEAYQGKVGDKTVDFLRAGRVALMYQTLDGKETGYWDASEKQWKQDNDYTDALRAGLKVAKKQAAPDFITVAVRAPKEIS